MELNRAISQIREIHRHLAKTQVYRGYRSMPVAFTGVLALLGGVLEPWVISGKLPLEFVLYWVGIAAASLLVVGSEIVRNSYFYSIPSERRMTLKVVGQFLPCLVAGSIVTAIIAGAVQSHALLLPGIWAILFSLGIFSSRPYLPRATGWVALFYLAGGSWLLWGACQGIPAGSWGMAAVFGLGQFLSALVLYWNLERREDG